MTTILIRAIVLYLVMILAIRSMGKRQLGQFQPFELAMALMIADILATPMSDVSTPLLHGIMPVAAMISMHALITVVCLKSDRARALISGKPSLIISGGVIDQAELNRLSLSISDLLEGLREFGIMNPWDVECAIMEANGTITAFSKSNKRPPTNDEIGIDASKETVPLALIMDGKIQKKNLNKSGVKENRLNEILTQNGLSADSTYLLTIDHEKSVTLQDYNGKIKTITALKEPAL